MPPTATHTPTTTVSLRLEASLAKVDAGDCIDVDVAFSGLEEVRLELVPQETFSLDLRSLRKTGSVRLKGREDGVATLIARGATATGEKREAMLHFRCDGAELKLLGWGYIPAED